MIVKAVIDESILTLAEAKELLNAHRKKVAVKTKEDGEAEEEMRYERRKTFEHTAKFAKQGAKESRELINELLELEKMKEEIAVRIADLMPQSKNEVRAIYAKERFTITETNIESILDCVAKFE